MKRLHRFLLVLLRWSWRLAGLGVLICTARLGWVLVERAPSSATLPLAPKSADLPRSIPMPRALSPSAPIAWEPDADTSQVLALPGGKNDGGRRRTFLMIDARPVRSEVLLDGVSLGLTPYLGEITCRVGAMLTITLIPPAGASRRIQRVCTGGELRVRD